VGSFPNLAPIIPILNITGGNPSDLGSGYSYQSQGGYAPPGTSVLVLPSQNPTQPNNSTFLNGGSIVPESVALSPAPQGDFNPEDLLGNLGNPLLTESQSVLGLPSSSTANTPATMQDMINSLGQAQPNFGTMTAPGGPLAPGTSMNTPVTSGLLGNTFAGFSWGRVGGFALGLILIAAGLFLLGRGELSGVATQVIKNTA